MSPTTEPMTGTEIARAVSRIEHGIDNISAKLDNKIDKADQIRKDAEQDSALKDIEIKVDKIVWSIAGLSLTSIGGVVLAIINRGAIQ